jgi:hypothetical protein
MLSSDSPNVRAKSVAYERAIMNLAIDQQWSNFVGRTDEERSVARRTAVIFMLLYPPIFFLNLGISWLLGRSGWLTGFMSFCLCVFGIYGAALIAGKLWPELAKKAEEDYRARLAKRPAPSRRERIFSHAMVGLVLQGMVLLVYLETYKRQRGWR